ncbi:sigma-54 dependent transcriptional regulator [bacterium]|nr:sigma-54 dependent transcriptional regulator [bacterium]
MAKIISTDTIEDIFGSSPAMQDINRLIKIASGSNTNILILGESGVGKEVVAQSIHKLSNRKDKPFVVVDCSTMAPNLIESELFGHEKGAFTGANTTKPGKFEMADGGTLFLDEIGNISPEIQAKLLRYIETQTFERVGGHKSIKTSVRFITATNVDLKEVSDKGLFRLDLYHRLNVFPLIIPPLRERKDDLPLFIYRFLEIMAKKNNRLIPHISEKAMTCLIEYDYPGNLRELRNIIERLVVTSDTDIDVKNLPSEIKNATKKLSTKKIEFSYDPSMSLKEISRQALHIIEKEWIHNTLAHTGDHYGKAAEILGITPRTLYNKMKELKIRAK